MDELPEAVYPPPPPMPDEPKPYRQWNAIAWREIAILVMYALSTLVFKGTAVVWFVALVAALVALRTDAHRRDVRAQCILEAQERALDEMQTEVRARLHSAIENDERSAAFLRQLHDEADQIRQAFVDEQELRRSLAEESR